MSLLLSHPELLGDLICGLEADAPNVPDK